VQKDLSSVKSGRARKL